MIALPLDTVNIDTSSAVAAQEYLAWIVFAVVLVAGIVAKVKMHYWSLEPELRRHLRSIRPALARASWEKVPIRHDEERGPRYQKVARAIDGDLEGRRSARNLLGGVRAGVAARLPTLDPLALRAGVEGVAILAFGLLVAISSEQWQALLFGSIDRAGDAGALVDGLSWLVETTIPGGSTLLALGLTFVILLYSLLLEYWFVIGVLLVALAAAVIELDRRTPTDLSPTLYPDRRRLARRSVMWVGVVWLSLLVATLAIDIINYGLTLEGYSEIGVALVGSLVLALSLLAVVGVFVLVFARLLERLLGVACMSVPWRSTSPTRDRDAVFDDITSSYPVQYDALEAARTLESRLEATGRFGGSWLTVCFVVVRQAVGALVVVALPVVLYFGLMALTTGSILGPLLAFGAAPWYGQVLVAVALVIGVLWAVTGLESAASLRQWVRRRVATGTVRSAVALRGLPVAAAVVGGLIGYAFLGAELSGSWWLESLFLLGLLFAITGGLAVVGVLIARWLWDRFGVTQLYSDHEPLPPTDQVVEVLSEPLEDADGRELYVARVDGRELAARDRETLLALVQRVVDERFETGETPQLLAHELYRAAVDRGVVDPDRVFRQVRGDVDTRIEATLEDHDGEIDQKVLYEELCDQYPKRLVESVLTDKRSNNQIGVSNGYVTLVERGFGGARGD